MSFESTFIPLRRKVLSAAFRLLYGPLVLLHEPIGRLLFGEAWNRRRVRTLHQVDASGLILDLGCGDGRLIRHGLEHGLCMVGVEPSKRMRSAGDRNLSIRAGTAQEIPLNSGSVRSVVITYPGRWIYDDRTWAEIYRVLGPGGCVAVLLGGTYERGPFRHLRAFLIKLAYGGSSQPGSPELNFPESLSIQVKRCSDEWGNFVLLTAKSAGMDQSSE